jgi:hypothetical protein
MEYKDVPVSDTVSIPVPVGLSPDEEAQYIVSRIAFVDLKALEAECAEAFEQLKQGKMIPLRTVLAELEKEYPDPDRKSA